MKRQGHGARFAGAYPTVGRGQARGGCIAVSWRSRTDDMFADMRARAAHYVKSLWAKFAAAAFPLQVGFVGTVLWLVLLAIYIGAGKGWVELWSLSLNNMGDFLAGAFAPLAFLWVVIAVLLQTAELGLQREELKQSREALELQAAETRALVEQNKLSVEVANKALAQQQRREREARLHQIIDALAFRIMNVANRSLVMVGPNKSEPLGNPQYLRAQVEAGGGRDAVFQAALRQIANWLHYVREAQQKPPPYGDLTPSAMLDSDLASLILELRRINTILEEDEDEDEPELETVSARVNGLNFAALANALGDVLVALRPSKRA